MTHLQVKDWFAPENYLTSQWGGLDAMRNTHGSNGLRQETVIVIDIIHRNAIVGSVCNTHHLSTTSLTVGKPKPPLTCKLSSFS